jgi:hypothetical protein
MQGIYAQDFQTNIKTAKVSYQSGKLEDAHFALQKAMQELDIQVGKEVMKLLPAKLDSLPAKLNSDNISGNTGFSGATIERSYEKSGKRAEISVVSNSPVIAVLNTYINNPALLQSSDGSTKVLKLQGYKAKLQRSDAGDGKFDYEIEVPLGSALISFKVQNSSESEIVSLANSIPLQQIAKLIQ